MPADTSCAEHPADDSVNEPHCFNGTNLHAHGLWVSPAGNSDNVLISINPQTSFTYLYNIPADHPAGTFWYHSHRHGSTALQVSSGMAGALIVRGDRLPTGTAHGDIDTLLTTRTGKPIPERILVLQQIQYACRDINGVIKVEKNAAGDVVAWKCDEGDVGGVELYDGFGPGSWPQSGRYTSINGQVLPTFVASAGGIERWRLIHAGVRDTIRVQFYRMNTASPQLNGLRITDNEKFIGDNCVGPPVPFAVFARDGLTMAAAKWTTSETLQPGYRSDLLVTMPLAGTYCMVNGEVSEGASVTSDAISRRLLGVVQVLPGRTVPDVRAYVTTYFSGIAKRRMPRQVRREIADDITNDFKLTNFTPHAGIADSEVTGTQTLTFNIDVKSTPVKFQISGDPYDPKSFDPRRIDRVFTLGSVDEWTLQSRLASHPFHIHVNPFQIVKILDPSGKDVSAEDAVDDAGGKPDSQYPGLKGVWKDTLWIKKSRSTNNSTGIYTVIVRTRYERYIGDYVLHCHILDHEDQGMMQRVRIDVPNAQPLHDHR